MARELYGARIDAGMKVVEAKRGESAVAKD
jgi:hypothetical protein